MIPTRVEVDIAGEDTDWTFIFEEMERHGWLPTRWIRTQSEAGAQEVPPTGAGRRHVSGWGVLQEGGGYHVFEPGEVTARTDIAFNTMGSAMAWIHDQVEYL